MNNKKNFIACKDLIIWFLRYESGSFYSCVWLLQLLLKNFMNCIGSKSLKKESFLTHHKRLFYIPSKNHIRSFILK